MTKDKIQNIELYESLLSLIKKAVEIISADIEKYRLFAIRNVWQIQENGVYLRQDIKRPEIVFFKAKDELFQTEEFKAFLML